jgi:hypothetical protein
MSRPSAFSFVIIQIKIKLELKLFEEHCVLGLEVGYKGLRKGET